MGGVRVRRVVLDCYSQRIVAWHAATTKTTPLVLTPLRIALWDRGRSGHPVRPGELIAHSDVGSQYTSLRFAEHLAAEGIAASIGTVADAYDNALIEAPWVSFRGQDATGATSRS